MKPLAFVTGIDGLPLRLPDLPVPGTTNIHWTPRRKAQLVLAIRGGLLSIDKACEYYALSPEEYELWANGFDRYGLRGLCTTNVRERRA